MIKNHNMKKTVMPIGIYSGVKTVQNTMEKILITERIH